MKKVFSFSLCLLFCTWFIPLNAQSSILKQAKQIEQAQNQMLMPTFVKFESDKAPAFSETPDFISRFVGSSEASSVKHIRAEQDELGFTHHRYQQTIDGIPIEGTEYIYHIKKGKVESANGQWFTDEALSTLKPKAHEKISEQEALQKALHHINAKIYKWELPDEEQYLKLESDDPTATYFPKGEKVFTSLNNEKNTEGVRLAWKFSIYAQEPLSRRFIYIDAENGQVLSEINQIHNDCMEKTAPKSDLFLAPIAQDNWVEQLTHLPMLLDVTGTATTGYSGIQTIKSTPSVGKYLLRESEDGLGRGKGIVTLNLANTVNLATATDFTSTTSNWTLAGLDKYALDAHYGTEKVYDYYKTTFNRNSIDNAGFKLIGYVHYGTKVSNAYWDGSRMIYGDGFGSPYTALDIVGHEITHGLTQKTAGLAYKGESGALNESFSDIFGTTIEFYAQPTAYAANWTLGELKGGIDRSMSNPGTYFQPSYYKGTRWIDTNSARDYGGVHTNSGVQNFWFYLLANGGSGTTEKGYTYAVTGIGIDKAAKIAYRNLTVYLTSTSNYASAANGSLAAATDLYGFNSPEYKAVSAAWCAVGVSALTPSVTIAVTSGKYPDCSGGPITLTATATNGGTNPIFQWKKNGINVGTGTTYTDVGTTSGAVTCVMTIGTGICPTSSVVTSTAIDLFRVTTTPSVTIAITKGTNPSHAGTAVTFTATPTNGGTNPTLQWKKNGLNVGTGTIYIDSASKSGKISCIMTPSANTCSTLPTASSSSIDLVSLNGPSILYVKPTASGSGNGTSWANASSNLQEMISISATGDQIWVAQGTYLPSNTSDVNSSFNLKNGVAFYGGFVGSETSLATRTATSIKNNATILSGVLTGANSIHIIKCDASIGNATILDGFTITGGRSTNTTVSEDTYGAGIYNIGSPTIKNCSFLDNIATNIGGAIYNKSSANPVIVNCTFTRNSARNGGAIYSANLSSSNMINITNCFFSSNTGVSGSAIYNQGSTNLTNCAFWNNSSGSALEITPITNIPTVILTNCSFAKNIDIKFSVKVSSWTVNIKNCILRNAFNYKGSNISVTNSIIPSSYAGVGNLTINPSFVDTLNGNLSLQPNSGAINAGSNADVPAGVVTDLAGNPRFYNNGIVDIGAYEYQGVRQVAPASAINTNNAPNSNHILEGALNPSQPAIEMVLSPNPAKSMVNVQLKSDAETNGQIALLDITGKTVFSIDAQLFAGQNDIPLNISSLPNGIYLCQFKDGYNLVKPVKLVKY